MPDPVTPRPVIGISACLYGCPVRYDGRALDAMGAFGEERSGFTFVPVCPECMAGFGVPRSPIRLTGPGEKVLARQARVLDAGGRDVTGDVIAGATACAEALDRAGAEAVVLKERSPSCALEMADVGRSDGTAVRGAGVFGALCARTGMILLTERELGDPVLWWDARRRLHAWLWLRRRAASTPSALSDAWAVVEPVVRATDRAAADDVGREVAALLSRPSAEALERCRARVFDALRARATATRARAALRRAYAGYRGEGPDAAASGGHEAMAAMAEDLTRLDRVSFSNDSLFGEGPPARRDGKGVAPKGRQAGGR